MEPNCSPPAFSSGTPLIVFGEEASIVVSGVIFPLSSAAVAVTTLNVEPGGYSSWVVRLRSGWFARSLFSWPIREGIRFGSYSGIDTITRTLPVDGSIATTAPLRPARPLTAASVPFRSRFVTTSLPSRSWLSSPDRIVANSFSLPDELLVPARLDAALPVRQVREADRMGEQAAQRVGARVGAVLAAPMTAAPRQHRPPVVGDDQPARDLLLLDQRPPVRRVLGERVGLEHRPPRGEDDQDREQDREEPEQLDDLAVHGARRALPAAARPRGRCRRRSGAARAAPCWPRSSCRRRRRTAASRRSAGSRA